MIVKCHFRLLRNVKANEMCDNWGDLDRDLGPSRNTACIEYRMKGWTCQDG
jgi:hypothetical protein